MKQVAEKLGNIEFDHKLWMNELSYAFEEISLYEERLMTLAKTSPERAKEEELEQFFLEFSFQKEDANQLIQDIKDHVILMNQKIASNGELKSIINNSHLSTLGKMENFRKNYSGLKQKFHQFVTLES